MGDYLICPEPLSIKALEEIHAANQTVPRNIRVMSARVTRVKNRTLLPNPPLRRNTIDRVCTRYNRECKEAEEKTKEWGELADEEAKKFSSIVTWADMTRVLADRSLNTHRGKLTRATAADKIIRKICEAKVGESISIEWALNQLHSCIFYQPSTHPPRTSITASLANQIERDCTRHDKNAYFQIFDEALLRLVKFENQNTRQAMSLRALYRVLDCTLTVYRLKIKSFVFTSLRKYTKLSRLQSSYLLRKVKRFTSITTMKRYFHRWICAMIVIRSQAVVDKETLYSKSMQPTINHLRTNLLAQTTERDSKIAKLKAEIETNKNDHLDELCRRDLEYQEQVQKERNLQAKLRQKEAEIESIRSLLKASVPGSDTRQPPPRHIVHAAVMLRNTVSACANSSDFPLVFTQGVDKLISSWISCETGAVDVTSVTQLVGERSVVLHELLDGLVPVMDSKLPISDKLAFCLTCDPAFSNPPLSFLCQTGAVLQLATSTGAASNRMLKTLSCIFLLHVCYSHLAVDAWPHAAFFKRTRSDMPHIRRAKAPPQAKPTAPQNPNKTLQALKAVRESEEPYASPEVQGSAVDLSFYRGFSETAGLAEINKAWGTIGALVVLWLNKTRQKQCSSFLNVVNQGFNHSPRLPRSEDELSF